jgi:hypothetical protein
MRLFVEKQRVDKVTGGKRIVFKLEAKDMW